MLIHENGFSSEVLRVPFWSDLTSLSNPFEWWPMHVIGVLPGFDSEVKLDYKITEFNSEGKKKVPMNQSQQDVTRRAHH